MKSQREQRVCPRCDYPLLPVHSVEGRKRRVIALTCPEPYCDHIEFAHVDDVDAEPKAQESSRRQVS